MIKDVLITLLFTITLACSPGKKEKAERPVEDKPTSKDVEETPNEALEEEEEKIAPDLSEVHDTSFVRLKDYADDFAYDMKYATTDNFLKKKVYPCAECLIRKEAAEGLIKANSELQSKGFRIKFFDCYRPLDIQKAMWEIFPNAKYVANPNTTGSMHNRGAAVDVTLEDLNGQELDMGTTFDHFGKEAHPGYTNLPDTVQSNRILLKSTMEKYRFMAITTEWWHYSYTSKNLYLPSNFKFECLE